MAQLDHIILKVNDLEASNDPNNHLIEIRTYGDGE
jgi:hypothetical protein